MYDKGRYGGSSSASESVEVYDHHNSEEPISADDDYDNADSNETVGVKCCGLGRFM